MLLNLLFVVANNGDSARPQPSVGGQCCLKALENSKEHSSHRSACSHSQNLETLHAVRYTKTIAATIKITTKTKIRVGLQL